MGMRQESRSWKRIANNTYKKNIQLGIGPTFRLGYIHPKSELINKDPSGEDRYGDIITNLIVFALTLSLPLRPPKNRAPIW